MAKKKKKPKIASAERKSEITQHKRDRVASILAVVIGLLSIRQGGSVLLGLWVPDYHVLPWLVWYNVVMGVVSVIAGIGIWLQRQWSHVLSTNILLFHAIVFVGLFGMYQFGETVAHQSIFAMMFRTFTWLVIYSLLRWKRQEGSSLSSR